MSFCNCSDISAGVFSAGCDAAGGAEGVRRIGLLHISVKHPERYSEKEHQDHDHETGSPINLRALAPDNAFPATRPAFA